MTKMVLYDEDGAFCAAVILFDCTFIYQNNLPIMMQLKDLCLSLVQCESEDEIITLLKQEKYWDKQNWQYFGGDDGNFSIIGNQQRYAQHTISLL